MKQLHPILLKASLHETIWGGRRLEQEGWKQLPPGDVKIGESWETETSTVAQNPPYTGKTLGELVQELGEDLLGNQTMLVYGQRFPLLAKFIDANDQLSVQVHPDDIYANENENGKLGKTEFWYILAADPGATIIHGFKEPADHYSVRRSIEQVQLEELTHEEPVQAGDVVFVPAGTVHAIGKGILLYELQQYSDVTYRMYDYGRLSNGRPRELHIEHSLNVSDYSKSPSVKTNPVELEPGPAYTQRCLVANRYFLTKEITLKGDDRLKGLIEGTTSRADSCDILTSLGAEIEVLYGDEYGQSISLGRGQTAVLPAALGNYRIKGHGVLLFSYVPSPEDEVWIQWNKANPQLSAQ